MRNKMTYVMVAGLAFGVLCQSAMADCYYKVLSPQHPILNRADSFPMERALSYPVVVERTSCMSVLIDGKTSQAQLHETTALPVVLERTSAARPHHWPLSFGVWP